MNILSSLLLHIILLIFFRLFFCYPFLLALLPFSCYYCFRAFPHFFQAHLPFPLQHFLQWSHFHLDHRDCVCHRAQLELFLLLLALLLFSFYYCFRAFPHFFKLIFLSLFNTFFNGHTFILIIMTVFVIGLS
jgi:hypothetical protein